VSVTRNLLLDDYSFYVDDYSFGVVVTATTGSNSKKFDYPFTFGGCVMARDDNLYLAEWIAYHYTVMPLRAFVIAIDPLSLTSPMYIIDQFQNALPDLNITIWTGNWYFEDGRWSREKYDTFDPLNHSSEHGWVFHLQRQRVFYTKCLQHLKQTSSAKFVAVFDSDERFTYNTPLKNIHRPSGERPTPIQDTLPRQVGRQNETFAHWIHNYYHPSDKKKPNNTIYTNSSSQFVMNDKSLCMSYPKLRFTGKQEEIKNNDTSHFIAQTTEPQSVVNALYTLKYQSYMKPKKNAPGKSFVHLGVYDGVKEVSGCHRPFGAKCDVTLNPSLIDDYPFRFHEYSSSLEHFMLRPTRSEWMWQDKNNLPIGGHDHSVSTWYQHFVSLVANHNPDNESLAYDLTVGAYHLAIEEWKIIKETHTHKPSKRIPAAFVWDAPRGRARRP
jgi:hypothetical protein